MIARAAALVLAASAPFAALTAQSRPAAVAPAAQVPSPMSETTRQHERLTARALAGVRRSFEGPGGRPVDLFLPDTLKGRGAVDVVIHFLGASWVPIIAIDAAGGHAAVALNLGAGSTANARPFASPEAFDSLVLAIGRELSIAAGHDVQVGEVTLSGFSAGYGAIRAILREPRHLARVRGVLLLDGLHTSYVPEGKLLADGGTIDPTGLDAFLTFARAAVDGDKRMLIAHSEIFPGAYASTTESTDWLLAQLGARRTAVLAWGPRGMQQLSEVRVRGLTVMGFAGNSAPDHVDFLHAMPELLARLLQP